MAMAVWILQAASTPTLARNGQGHLGMTDQPSGDRGLPQVRGDTWDCPHHSLAPERHCGWVILICTPVDRQHRQIDLQITPWRCNTLHLSPALCQSIIATVWLAPRSAVTATRVACVSHAPPSTALDQTLSASWGL